jgi:hypothetical protein
MRPALLRALLVVLLTGSLSVKVLGSVSSGDDPPSDVPQSIHTYLEQRGFALSQQPSMDGPALVAISGLCRIEIANVSPHGWHRSAMEQEAGQRTLVYFYGGVVYDQQPLALTKLGYYWHKLMHYFTPSTLPSVRAAIIAPECPSGAASLDTLAQLSG